MFLQEHTKETEAVAASCTPALALLCVLER